MRDIHQRKQNDKYMNEEKQGGDMSGGERANKRGGMESARKVKITLLSSAGLKA